MNTCQNCRAFFPVEETLCPHCGTSILPKKLRIEGGFFDRVLPAGKGLSMALIAVNVAVFFATVAVQGEAVGSYLGVSNTVLVKFGALYSPWIREHNEWWRLVCPIFLHGNLIHLGMNCLVTWFLGRPAEIIYGPAKMLTLYLACGIAASATSLAWRWGSPVPSVGASGAVFGLFGLLGVFAFRRGDEGMKRSVIQWTLINIVIGLTVSRIDLAAHMGGLAAGVLLGLKVKEAPRTRLSVRAVRLWDAGAFASIALVLGCLGIAVLTGGLLASG